MEYNVERCKHYVVNQAGNAIDALIQIYGIDAFQRLIEKRQTRPNPKYEQLVASHRFDVLCDKIRRIFGEDHVI
jgi:hypothetical protein